MFNAFPVASNVFQNAIHTYPDNAGDADHARERQDLLRGCVPQPLMKGFNLRLGVHRVERPLALER